MDQAAKPGLVYDIQRFSVHDGPGIRTTVFFKGCPLRCRWCQNPESLRPRVELAFLADRCAGSGECLASCPRGALASGPERILRDRCDGCGQCVAACAFGALRLVGQAWTPGELADEVARDLPFFRASGGGVTLSGGEPTLQMGFICDLTRELRARGIGVGLQTCGVFAWDDFARLLPSLDFVFFDLKQADPEDHRRDTGADNRAIRANARKLSASGAKVTFRMPVVPGWNDSVENLTATAAFLTELHAPRLHLLAYHAMGEAKLSRVGSPIPPLEPGIDPGCARRRLEAARQVLAENGIEVTS